MMNRWLIPLVTLCSVNIVTGCGSGRIGDSREAAREARVIHQEKIDNLVPEGGVGRRRLPAIIEAMRTVRKDISKEELPQDSGAARRVLRKFTIAEIDRVEAILPVIEKRRRDEGLD